MKKHRALWGWLFISPWVAGIMVFFVWPMLEAFRYSVSKITVGETGFVKTFVGADNFIYFFTKDTFFLRNLTESIGSIIPSVLMIITFSVVIAVILKEEFFGRTAARTVFFFPVIIASGVIITILKQQVMMSGSNVSDLAPGYLFRAPSLVNVFGQLGVPDSILQSITTVLNQIFDLTWKSGVQILLLLAAIKNIPGSFYDVAVMEGATGWEKFWKITFPTIMPTLLVAVIYTIIDGFTDYGNKVMQQLRDFYVNNNYSYSATIGVIYFICILAIVGIVNALISRKTFYA